MNSGSLWNTETDQNWYSDSSESSVNDVQEVPFLFYMHFFVLKIKFLLKKMLFITVFEPLINFIQMIH